MNSEQKSKLTHIGCMVRRAIAQFQADVVGAICLQQRFRERY
jgi:hypothetical protein